jgi:hypothetical protein
MSEVLRKARSGLVTELIVDANFVTGLCSRFKTALTPCRFCDTYLKCHGTFTGSRFRHVQ